MFENLKLDTTTLRQDVTKLKGVDQKQYYNIDLYNGDSYAGYVILGELDGKQIVVEYGITPSPVQKVKKNKGLASTEILYGGPLFSFAVDIDKEKK